MDSSSGDDSCGLLFARKTRRSDRVGCGTGPRRIDWRDARGANVEREFGVVYEARSGLIALRRRLGLECRSRRRSGVSSIRKGKWRSSRPTKSFRTRARGLDDPPAARDRRNVSGADDAHVFIAISVPSAAFAVVTLLRPTGPTARLGRCQRMRCFSQISYAAPASGAPRTGEIVTTPRATALPSDFASVSWGIAPPLGRVDPIGARLTPGSG